MSCFHRRDKDFFHAAARAACLERRLITEEELIKAAGAGSLEEALRQLCTRQALMGSSIDSYEETLNKNMMQTFELVEDITGNMGITDIFRYPTDGHNLKVMAKGSTSDKDFSWLYEGGGTVEICSPDTEQRALTERKLIKFPNELRAAYDKAIRQLAETGDPQLADAAIDKAVLLLMAAEAEKKGIVLLIKYAEAMADMADMTSALRLLRIGANAYTACQFFSGGGSAEPDELRAAYVAGYRGQRELALRISGRAAMAEAVDIVEKKGIMDAFEAEKEGYIRGVFERAATASLGIEPVIRFLYMKMREVRGCRFVLTALRLNVPEKEIKKRIRWLYG